MLLWTLPEPYAVPVTMEKKSLSLTEALSPGALKMNAVWMASMVGACAISMSLSDCQHRNDGEDISLGYNSLHR